MQAVLAILIMFGALNVPVIEKNLPSNIGAIYDIENNEVWVNENMPIRMLQISLTHEGIHMAQDCKAGIENTEMATLGLEVPEELKPQVDLLYYNRPAWHLPLEYEAITYENDTHLVVSLIREHCLES